MKLKLSLILLVSLSINLIIVNAQTQTLKEQMDRLMLKQRQEAVMRTQQGKENLNYIISSSHQYIEHVNQVQKEADQQKKQDQQNLAKEYPNVAKKDQEQNSSAAEKQDVNQIDSTSETVGNIDSLPACDCDDPNYNYPSNFYYDYQHRKIMRFYPTKCRCNNLNTKMPNIVTLGSSDSQMTNNTQADSQPALSTQKKGIFDIQY